MHEILNHLETNDKLGFYTVGSQKYHNKIQALIHATETGIHPHWNFNESVFNACVWQYEPESSIRQLYRKRAQQLRENYDYIILNLSGGADSATVLYSFINNGLHLDEIIVRHPETGLKNCKATRNTNVAENSYSEWEYAAKPLLNWVKAQSPATKITIHDYAQDLIVPDYDIDWVFAGRDYLHPGIIKRYAYDIPEFRSVYEKKARVCVLFGIDKPRICIHNGFYNLYFLDIQANTAVSEIKDYDNISTEYFYWTPDLPEIAIKQAHMIANWFEYGANQNLRSILRWPNSDISQRTTYEMIVKTIIYPDYDFTTFQAVKPNSAFETEIDSWFYKNFTDTKAFQIWQAGIEFVKTSIDDRWFNFKFENKDGFVGFISPFYQIKEAHGFSS
jgi:hypothetical protein